MKRNRLISSLALLMALPAVAAPVPGPPRAITDPASVVSPVLTGSAPVPVADLYYVRGGSDAVWTRDGRSIVFSTNLTGRYNLWTMPAMGGFPRQLTVSDDPQSGLATSPDGKWLIFEADRAGAEIYDLFAVPLAGGAPINLTGTDDTTETGARFSPDGALIAFDRRLKSGSVTDVAIMDWRTRAVRLLTHEASPDRMWSVVAFSPDGRRLIATRARAPGTEAAVWSIDVANGAATELTPATGAFNSASDIAPDGRTIALTTEGAGGNHQAALLDVATGKVRALAPDVWDQTAGHFTPDGTELIFVRNVDGRTTLARYALAGGTVSAVGPRDGVNNEASGQGTSIAPDGRRMLIGHQASNTPFDYWVADLATGGAQPVTHLGLASIDPARLPAAQVVHYASEDGTIVSALLWMPFNLARNAGAPAILLPHGGPTGQTVDSFSRTALALASRGYLVLAPNPRGSTGYGRAFELANRKDLGGADLVDEVYGRRFLIATGYADPKRIGITGGSYGGFMTIMAAAKTPDLWAAAVEEYGILDWVAMYQHEAPTLQQYQMGLIGDPVRDAAVYKAASPLTYIHALTAPLLILQGENDIRVPREQAANLAAVLKTDGRTVDAHFYANEGHGFAKRENQIDALERTIAWFDRYLKPVRAD